ncbi:stage III sporulation protein AF [Blautia wexlerae]|uniref:Stage III sporulation protein AF n=1 Tax=Blautia obeum TaxID=40520 RepID=A0A414I3W5_9FIRM|nr:stage III sporulation protein AF [Blautia massiliensis (ex Durand et al. 2017)]NSD00948.1 stage III sporulation protein AF [Blautia wexlerae]RGW21439.1 stage III sporulation protein AF [Ruminococcus sp. AF13-37]RGW24093.1 stage III sporulation protein AF [Ruminococcus sp. AF13-28]RHE10131.1 stage III sporulation protein AF [Blautia obeum]RHO43449.1 stage III sporulation protein AF [Ruminococcus sp. AM12-48]RHT65657.1 stage III sporulation protein AF [Ruminococcus sp. AM28-41]
MINVEKKNPYKFTLGFDKTKPTHVCAAEILNSVRDKADLIASAVVAHIDGGSTEKGAVLNQEALQIMMLELVKQEVEKAMQNYFSKQENVQVEEETEEDVIEKQKISEFVLAPEVAKSVRDAMSAFRNR